MKFCVADIIRDNEYPDYLLVIEVDNKNLEYKAMFLAGTPEFQNGYGGIMVYKKNYIEVFYHKVA